MKLCWELSGRLLDLRLRGRGFELHQRHCVVSLSKNINPSLVLVQPRKTSPYITEKLLMGRNKQTNEAMSIILFLFSYNFKFANSIIHLCKILYTVKSV